MHMQLNQMLIFGVTIVALISNAVFVDVRERQIRPSSVAWLMVPLGMVIWAAVWCGLGLYEGGDAEISVLSVSSLVSGACILQRWQINTTVRRLSVIWRCFLGVAVVLACSVFAFISIELPYSDGVTTLLPRFAILEVTLILCLLATLLFLFQKHGVGMALGVTACALVGVASYFVASFKGSAILPSDLLVLGTAAAVSGGYVYSVNGSFVLGLSSWIIAIGLCSLVLPLSDEYHSKTSEWTRNLGIAGALAVTLSLGIALPSYEDGMHVYISYWNTLWSYRTHGFLPTFIAVFQDLAIEVPEGYSDAHAIELEDKYSSSYDEAHGSRDESSEAQKQFNELKPSIIYIVNESFSDFSIYDGASWGYAGPLRYSSVDDALFTGPLTVSTTGGGTCNAEFELLTGVSLAYVGEGKYPFALYDLSGAPSVVKQLSDLGYKTTSMHPNLRTNYNRDVAYQSLGFDSYLSIEDFEGYPGFHSGISDSATYSKILDILKSDDDPQFIFDLTMQNHSSYNLGNLGEVEHYSIEGLTESENSELSEYIACIEESDRALADFMQDLKRLDRPVVLVFIGDHQPHISPILNDAIYPEEDTYLHTARLYETTALAWANYDVAGREQISERRFLGLSSLSALTFEAIGAPLTDFQKSELVISDSISAISLMGVRDIEGEWTTLQAARVSCLEFNDLRNITYYEFARKVD